MLRRIVSSRLSIIVLVVLLVLSGKGVFSMYEKYREAVTHRQESERQVAQLADREQFLKREIERLATTQGVEQEIRQKFNVKKQGEEVVVIVEPNENKNAALVQSRAASVWLWFKSFFTRD